MKPLTPELEAALYSPSGILEVVDLFTFEFSDAWGGLKRWSSADAVTFGGVTWAAGPTFVGSPRLDQRSGLEVGTLDVEIDPGNLSLTLSGPNAGKTMKIAALEHAFRKVRVVYHRAYFTAGVCQGVLAEFDGTVGKVAPGSTTIAITVRSVLSKLSSPLPKRTIQAPCPYRFKEPNTCKYAGAETECDRTLTRCKALANEARYGGFPFVPSEEAS